MWYDYVHLVVTVWTYIYLNMADFNMSSMIMLKFILRVGIMLAERLKECRKVKNVTQSEAARYLGIELRTYQRYESGQREPNASILAKMADLFEVSTDHLLERKND